MPKRQSYTHKENIMYGTTLLVIYVILLSLPFAIVSILDDPDSFLNLILKQL